MLNDYCSKMIKDFYMTDVESSVQELETVRFTANIALKNLQMIDAIASRFNTSRASIVEDVLNNSALSLFANLEISDRDKLSSECDKIFHSKIKEIYKENGGSYKTSGLGEWASLNYAITEGEKRRNLEGSDDA